MNEFDTHNPCELISNWQTALRYLKEGNKRYLEDRTAARDNAKDRKILKDEQKPFAVILTCSDSRVPPEILFDQKLGNIFVVRNAGNTAGITVLGSIEFAVKCLLTSLVVVMGHSNCAAVIAAYNGGEYPKNSMAILDAIGLAVKNCKSPEDAIRANINYTVSRIKENKIVKEMGITVTGAHYDLESGEVLFDI